MQAWKTQVALEIARTYWRLPATASVYDVVLAIRADEAHHRYEIHEVQEEDSLSLVLIAIPCPNRKVNHTLAELKENDPNPFPPGRD